LSQTWNFRKVAERPVRETHLPAFISGDATSTQARLVIAADALDECERERDIRTILHLLLQTQHLEIVHICHFLTSRPELPIHLKFAKISADAYQDVVLQDIPPITMEHDISIS